MPFGKKMSWNTGETVDFDDIYIHGIRPAVEMAGMKAVRADEEMTGGMIYKPLFERIINTDVVIADLTTANPNIMYELGIRHAAKSNSTIIIFADDERLPFDVALFKAIPYKLKNGKLAPELTKTFIENLSKSIVEGINSKTSDSPLFMLIDGYNGISLPNTDKLPEIFLSYGREDEVLVDQLYKDLMDKGFRPWLDRKSIKPGENWELAIDMAMRRADFILVCLSEKSCNKRGFIRKEIRAALEKSNEMLDTDIFLIPVRLDKCELPLELKKFQWVDLFTDKGIENLSEALKEGFMRRHS